MKAVFFFAAVLAVVVVADSIFDDEMIANINSGNHGWTAERSSRFEDHSVEDVKRMMGANRRMNGAGFVSKDAALNDATAIPSNFNALNNWGISPLIKNQAQCGSCWAFSATSVLGYRFTMAANISTSISLSPEDPVSCDFSDMGCNGGELANVWNFMQNKGVVLESCFPYASQKGQSPACPTNQQCPGSGAWKPYYAKNFYHVTSMNNRVQTIQKEMMLNGPVQVAFTVYQDFMAYSGGVYKHVSGSELGGHAVTFVGWGETADSTPYWIVQNSWGPSWGLTGNFWILRGSNECGIEADVYAGLPKTG